MQSETHEASSRTLRYYRRSNGEDAIADTFSCRDFKRNPKILPIIDFLLCNGVTGFPQPTVGSSSALMSAAFKARFDVVQRLLDAGAPPVQFCCWTPLMHAAALGSLPALELILAQGPCTQDDLDAA